MLVTIKSPDTCNKQYIGQTAERSFKARFKEYISNKNSTNKINPTRFAKHLIETSQTYTTIENNLQILHKFYETQ